MSGDRISVTQRPTTAELLEEMHTASTLSRSDLYNAGLDVLHFVWEVTRNGGKILTQFGGQPPMEVHILVPGLLRRGEGGGV